MRQRHLTSGGLGNLGGVGSQFRMDQGRSILLCDFYVCSKCRLPDALVPGYKPRPSLKKGEGGGGGGGGGGGFLV